MRIVSLVPSLTETLFALGLGAGEIVGRTSYCIEPALGVAPIPTVGGTKNPDLPAILDLRPSLVLLEKEENRRQAYEWLSERGVPTFVAHVLSVADVPEMLRMVGDQVDRREAASSLVRSLENELSDVPAPSGLSAVVLIWNHPLMAVAPSRYAGDVVRYAGVSVLDVSPGEPYPKVDLLDLVRLAPDFLLLTSEPYDFSLAEGEALAQAMEDHGVRRPLVRKLEGAHLTWFGSRTEAAVRYFRALGRSFRPMATEERGIDHSGPC